MMCHVHNSLSYKNGVSRKAQDKDNVLTGWYSHIDQLDSFCGETPLLPFTPYLNSIF